MSIHPSLRGVDTLAGERSVLSRVERLNVLMKRGKFKPEENSVYGLPKVRTRFKVAGAKKAKKGAEGEAAAAPAPVAAAEPAKPAKPAKAAKPGKGKK